MTKNRLWLTDYSTTILEFILTALFHLHYPPTSPRHIVEWDLGVSQHHPYRPFALEFDERIVVRCPIYTCIYTYPRSVVFVLFNSLSTIPTNNIYIYLYDLTRRSVNKKNFVKHATTLFFRVHRRLHRRLLQATSLLVPAVSSCSYFLYYWFSSFSDVTKESTGTEREVVFWPFS